MLRRLCQLRSTQCAALIAMAAAAGISRFADETTVASVTEATPAQCASATSACPAVSAWARSGIWLSAERDLLHAAVTATVVGEVMAALHASSLAEVAANPVACGRPTIEPKPSFPTAVSARALSSLNHALPFAVGPPRRGSQVHPTACAIRLSWLDDRSAPRVSLRPIIPSLVLPDVFPGVHASPSNALRGLPEALTALHALRGFPRARVTPDLFCS